MGRRKIDDNGRANIIAFAILAGYPHRRGSTDYVLKKISGQTMDYRTLRRWYLNIDLDLVEQKIMDLKKLLEVELDAVFEEMSKKRSEASYRDLATTMGIMSDKIILLQGGATNRTETISGNWRDVVEAAREENRQKPFKPEMEFKEKTLEN